MKIYIGDKAVRPKAVVLLLLIHYLLLLPLFLFLGGVLCLFFAFLFGSLCP